MNTRKLYFIVLTNLLLFVGGSQTTIYGQTNKVKSIQVPTFVEMNVGDTSPIKVVVSPESASNKNCKWICDSPDMLKIDKENGTVTGLKVGNVNIKIAAEDGSGVWAICRIKVNVDPAKLAEAKDNIVYDMMSKDLDKEPSFAGKSSYEGVGKFADYIANHFKCPATISKDNEKWVTFNFTVEKDGSVTDINIKRSSDSRLNEAFIRFVESTSMPKWEPATKDGKPVRSRFNKLVKTTF